MYTSTAFTVLGLAALGSSHMIMNTPTPFGKSTLNNSPLDASGSDFPCKQRTGVYDAEGASNTWPLGSTQELAFTGSAVHGGGSCQVSITYDEAPTSSSTWKVIHSIEGGCPMKGVSGNNGDSASQASPDTYSFTVPTTLPTGTAVMAWTWFNKIGNREMYMNCAPITLTSSSSKRSTEDDLVARNATQLVERDTAAYNALPNMFVANIPTTDCETQDSTDLKFPNPGDSLDLFGTATMQPSPPVGTACGATGTAAATSKATGGASSVATSSAKATQKATTSAGGIPGGVFATVATSAKSKATSTSIPGGVFATVATSAKTSAAATSATSSAASAASPAASSGASSGSTGSGTAEVAGSACSTEGMWNCIGGTSYQRCASGTWSVVQELSSGTTCTVGQSSAINITSSTKAKAKRAVRFSGEHIRRHIHKS